MLRGMGAIPSMQLCIENVDQGGGCGCGYGYSCVYTDAISWAAPNRRIDSASATAMAHSR
jgi:hypothetical protein